jgi:hypothetical protein
LIQIPAEVFSTGLKGI